MSSLKKALCGLCMLMSPLCARASTTEASMSPEKALQELVEGNQRFIRGEHLAGQFTDGPTRHSLATSQHPFAIILACSDSRVPPEIIFDQGLGELFVVRVAGNIPDNIIIGSIEYAAEHLGSSLVMVLGHERCGAVTATVRAKGVHTGSSNLDAIIHAIEPSILKAEQNPNGDISEQMIESVIDANVKAVADGMTKRSAILDHLVQERKIRIVAAKYDLDEGTVTLFDH
jgi:carbonic anhydrase